MEDVITSPQQHAGVLENAELGAAGVADLLVRGFTFGHVKTTLAADVWASQTATNAADRAKLQAAAADQETNTDLLSQAVDNTASDIGKAAKSSFSWAGKVAIGLGVAAAAVATIYVVATVKAAIP